MIPQTKLRICLVNPWIQRSKLGRALVNLNLHHGSEESKTGKFSATRECTRYRILVRSDSGGTLVFPVLKEGSKGNCPSPGAKTWLTLSLNLGLLPVRSDPPHPATLYPPVAQWLSPRVQGYVDGVSALEPPSQCCVAVRVKGLFSLCVFYSIRTIGKWRGDGKLR